MLLGDSRGCLDAIQRIGARLLAAKKALIINSGRKTRDHCRDLGCILPKSQQ